MPTLCTHPFGTREVGGFSDDINDKYPHFHQAQKSSDVRKLSPALCLKKTVITAAYIHTEIGTPGYHIK